LVCQRGSFLDASAPSPPWDYPVNCETGVDLLRRPREMILGQALVSSWFTREDSCSRDGL
jgi:hypothetical protein